MIKEISWYLPNVPGQFGKVLQALAQAGVNIRGFSVDLSGAYSMVRLACDNPDAAKRELAKFEYAHEEASVFALSMPDRPGELLRIARILGEHDINISYGYVTLGPRLGEALVILKTDREDEARKVFASNGILDHESIPNPPSLKKK